MSDKSKSSGSGSFDLDQLRELIEMMEAHGVTEVNLRQGEQQWRLRRGPDPSTMPIPQMPAMPAMPAAAPAPAPSPATDPAGQSAPAAPANDGLIEIKSPTVGTFYSSPSPEDPVFVKVGSQVSADTVVCLVEAMKVFNQIPAECNGIIEEVLLKDGDAVDFGQALYKVRPS